MPHKMQEVPMVVKLIVNHTGKMCGSMTAVMFLLAIIAYSTIMGQEEAFPTTGNSGFQDRLDINSLSVDAMSSALSAKEAAEALAAGVEVEKKCEGWGCRAADDDDSVVTPLTKGNRRWNNLLIFSAKGEGGAKSGKGEGNGKGGAANKDDGGGGGGKHIDILTPAALAKTNGALNRLLAQPGYEHFCQLSAKGGIWGGVAAAMSGKNVTEYECGRLLSPLTWVFPSTIESTYKIGKLDMTLMSAVMPLLAGIGSAAGGGGGGGGAWGRRLLELHSTHRRNLAAGKPNATSSAATMNALVAMFPKEGTEMFVEPHLANIALMKIMMTLTKSTKMVGAKTAVFDGKGTAAGGSCVVKSADYTSGTCDISKLSCTSCNSQWCACDTSAGTGTAQARVDSVLKLVQKSGFASFMMGKEFAKDNLKSHIMRFTLAYGGPLKADNPYLSLAEKAKAAANVKAGKPAFRNPQDKGICDEEFGVQRECQTAAFTVWAKEEKPFIDSNTNGCDFDALGNSWTEEDRAAKTRSTEMGVRPASLDCSAAVKAYGKLSDEKNLGDEIELLYLWSSISFQEILNVLYHDGFLAIFSIAFVVIYLRVHSGSWFLAALGMTHIMMSFPLAFCVYRFVFGIMPFYVLSFLSIYIILAIGADDIFVFIDAWRQSAREEGVCVNLEQRMTWVYRRAAKAMLITSATTFGAFTATALSKLNDVSTFGLFTAALVLANYCFVITYFPCVVLLYHRRFEGRPSKRGWLPCGCMCMKQERERGIVVTPEPGQEDAVMPSKPIGAEEGDVQDGVVVKVERRRMEVFFEDKLLHFVNVPLHHKVMVCLLSLIAVVLVFNNAVNLGPTTKADQLLPDWHPFQRLITMFNDDFATGSDTPMKTNCMLWGFDKDKPINKDGIGRYEADLGKVQYDGKFDLSEPASQAYMVKVCQDLISYQVKGGLGDGKKVVGQPLDFPCRQNAGLGQREVMCPMIGFKEYQLENNRTFPVAKPQFISELQGFMAWRKNQSSRAENPRRWQPHENYEGNLWIDTAASPPRVKMAVIKYNTTLGLWDSVYGHLDAAYDTVLSWKKDVSDNAPAGSGMGNPIIAGESKSGQNSGWVFLNTQKMLVTGAIWGAGSSAVFAFIVLCISTGNPLVSFFAISNILCITGCILGLMNVLGWELGVIESVSCTILVGLSVDYVVHLANSYMGSPKPSRADRVTDAFAEMGITVFGGAITSLGASGMLFACYFQTFLKFGGFMFMTISLSFVFANCYFMPLLAWVGPEGTFCSYGHAANRPSVLEAIAPGEPDAESKPLAGGSVEMAAMVKSSPGQLPA